MTFAIQTDGLKRHFGSVKAVDGLDLQVPTGSVFGFLGPNGSGKTTTIRLLLGLIRPDAGIVRLNGNDLFSSRVRALSSVGSIVETPTLYPNLTGRELLRTATLMLSLDVSEIDRVLEIVGLQNAQSRLVKTYSLGMRQRLGIARALLGQPKLLILDEPINGLDPAGIADMRSLIKSLPERSGTTVFVSSHQLSEMEVMTDHCALIRSGRLLYQGTLKCLLSKAPSRFRIETDNVDIASRIAKCRGLPAEVTSSELVITMSLTSNKRAGLIRELIGAGCAVSSASVENSTLEALFLSLTEAPA